MCRITKKLKSAHSQFFCNLGCLFMNLIYASTLLILLLVKNGRGCTFLENVSVSYKGVIMPGVQSWEYTTFPEKDVYLPASRFRFRVNDMWISHYLVQKYTNMLHWNKRTASSVEIPQQVKSLFLLETTNEFVEVYYNCTVKPQGLSQTAWPFIYKYYEISKKIQGEFYGILEESFNYTYKITRPHYADSIHVIYNVILDIYNVILASYNITVIFFIFIMWAIHTIAQLIKWKLLFFSVRLFDGFFYNVVLYLFGGSEKYMRMSHEYC